MLNNSNSEPVFCFRLRFHRFNVVEHVEPTPFDIHATFKQRKGTQTLRLFQPWPRLAGAPELCHVHVRAALFG